MAATRSSRGDDSPRRKRHTLTSMQMPVERIQDGDEVVVNGPCPGCQSWQFDYTAEVAASYADIEMPSLRVFGQEEEILMDPVIDMQPFRNLVEDLLAEHLAECRHLQQVINDF